MAFIIAEVGSNWQSIDDCLKSVQLAKICGADAVKFQHFSYFDLYGIDGPVAAASLPVEWMPKIKEKADSCQIEFMCSAFSVDGIHAVDPFVKRHKIASSDVSNLPLLNAASKLEKPVIISTGGHSMADMRGALSALEFCDVTVMYCVSNYPAWNVNLFGIEKIKELGKRVGYSCHTMDWYTPVAAVKYHDAKVIEKHFKLDHIQNTPDAPHSLRSDEFKRMVRAIENDYDVAMPDPQEKDMLLKHNKRLIVTHPIKAGEAFVLNKNFGVYRSLKSDMVGLSGFACYHVHNKLCTGDLNHGDAIGPSAIKF